MLTRRLLRCIREVDGRRQYFHQKNVGTISSSWRAVARVVCDSREADPRVEWNMQAVVDFDIDKSRILDLFMAGLPGDTPEDVQWGV